MQKASLDKLVSILIDAVFKIRIISQFELLKNLLQDVSLLRKKLPQLVIVLGLLMAGVVISWGLLIVLGIFELHRFSMSWLQGMSIMLMINLCIMVLMVSYLIMSLKKIRQKNILVTEENAMESQSEDEDFTGHSIVNKVMFVIGILAVSFVVVLLSDFINGLMVL